MHIVTLHSSGYLMDRIKTRELIHFTRRVTKKKKKKKKHTRRLEYYGNIQPDSRTGIAYRGHIEDGAVSCRHSYLSGALNNP